MLMHIKIYKIQKSRNNQDMNYYTPHINIITVNLGHFNLQCLNEFMERMEEVTAVKRHLEQAATSAYRSK